VAEVHSQPVEKEVGKLNSLPTFDLLPGIPIIFFFFFSLKKKFIEHGQIFMAQTLNGIPLSNKKGQITNTQT
jgi:hypothetical protein